MPKQGAGALPEFRLFETAEFLRRLRALEAREAEKIRRKLRQYVCPQLRVEPFFGPHIKKLRGYTPDTWRYRIGKFRIFFTVDTDEHIVFILSVDVRRDAYR